MGYWNSRGLRGSVLEDIINLTNELYESKGLALIQKIPTPIKPIEIDNEKRVIKLAYFEKKSTVDYIGAVQGIPICFDAKETNKKSIPIQNIHEHQIEFMKNFEKQGGVSFLVVYFSEFNDYMFVPFDVLNEYYLDSLKGGRKSIPYKELDKTLSIKNSSGRYINYLETLNVYLNMKK